MARAALKRAITLGTRYAIELERRVDRLHDAPKRRAAVGEAEAKRIFYRENRLLWARELAGFRPDNHSQEKLLFNAWKRAILRWHRQAGKSTTTAVLAAHRAMLWDAQLILIFAAAERQAKELLRKVVDVLDRPMVRAEYLKKSSTEVQITNLSRIIALPASEGTVRGFSAVDLLLEDEAGKVPDALHHAIRPMLARSGGDLALMSSPAGKRGHFYDTWQKGGDAWLKLKLRADENPGFPKDFLEQERAEIPDPIFRQEYDVEFLDAVNSIFREADILAAIQDLPPMMPDNDIEAMLGGADFSAITYGPLERDGDADQFDYVNPRPTREAA